MSAARQEGTAAPRIEVLAGSPTDAELAAVTIAVERLLAEDAAAAAGETRSRWQQAALADGVAAFDAAETGWGTPSNTRSR